MKRQRLTPTQLACLHDAGNGGLRFDLFSKDAGKPWKGASRRYSMTTVRSLARLGLLDTVPLNAAGVLAGRVRHRAAKVH